MQNTTLFTNYSHFTRFALKLHIAVNKHHKWCHSTASHDFIHNAV